MAEFTEEHRDELPKGALIGVRLLAEGEEPQDPIDGFDAGRAAEEHQAMLRRLEQPL